MIYSKKTNKLFSYTIYLLIPAFSALSVLIIFSMLDHFDIKLFLLLFLVASVWIMIRWNTWAGKFIKNSLNFIKCETTQEGLHIFSKGSDEFILWNQIIRVNFQDYSFFGARIVDKNLGNFIITDNLNRIFEIPVVIENRDLLIEEIANNAGLQEKHQGLLGESNSGYTYWERDTKNENTQPTKSVNLFKHSSFSDYLIAGILVIVMFIAIILIFHYMQTGKWFAV
jgi:hypothetical protein